MAGVVELVAFFIVVGSACALLIAAVVGAVGRDWSRAPRWVRTFDGWFDRFMRRVTTRQVVTACGAWLLVAVVLVVAAGVEKDNVQAACRDNGGLWVGNSVSGACVDRDAVIP